MKRKDAFSLTLLILGILILYFSKGQLQAAGQGALTVTAKYTGKGVVDQQHKIFVMLMDANPFTSSALVDTTSQPIPPAGEAGVAHVLAVQGTPERETVLTFRDVPASPVYIIALYDKNGEYNGHVGSFSQGNPMGIYGEPPDKLTPVKVERKASARISVVFDDSRVTP